MIPAMGARKLDAWASQIDRMAQAIEGLAAALERLRLAQDATNQEKGGSDDRSTS